MASQDEMTDNVENLILEHLKRFQGGQDRIERKLEEIVARIGQRTRPSGAAARFCACRRKRRRDERSHGSHE